MIVLHDRQLIPPKAGEGDLQPLLASWNGCGEALRMAKTDDARLDEILIPYIATGQLRVQLCIFQVPKEFRDKYAMSYLR
jgi:hypothetical protein